MQSKIIDRAFYVGLWVGAGLGVVNIALQSTVFLLVSGIFWVVLAGLACVYLAVTSKEIIIRGIAIVLSVVFGFALIYVIASYNSLIEQTAELRINENLNEVLDEFDAVLTLMNDFERADLEASDRAAYLESLDALDTAFSEFKSVYFSTSETTADSGADKIMDAHRIDELNRAANRLRKAVSDFKQTITSIMGDAAE